MSIEKKDCDKTDNESDKKKLDNYRNDYVSRHGVGNCLMGIVVIIVGILFVIPEIGGDLGKIGIYMMVAFIIVGIALFCLGIFIIRKTVKEKRQEQTDNSDKDITSED